MGVTNLWTVLQPCARPIKLDTLNRKRLAVDASIWIYQFLKAVRDKEGNALRNSHVVGFFRRICKLLYFGIKPVFVFDGGAPALKRSTIAGRKRRREGRREDAVRTAGRLLAVEMKRRAEEEERKRKEEKEHERVEKEAEIREEDLVYVDEIGMNEKERKQNRKFKRQDQYHLPDLDVSIGEMGAPNDPRVMSQQELEEYAKQFHRGEEINFYDFSKINFESPFFLSLPLSDRYNILNAARLRSRLRMGLSKDQLDNMFPDRMAFSKFQVERVRERNELTQRLMHLTGFSGTDGTLYSNVGGRIAGEKGREYVLVKNDGVEGGWALGVVSAEGREGQPIDVDEYGKENGEDEDNEEDWEDEDEFEDVPIEGLNRLPKIPRLATAVDDEEVRAREIAEKRRAVYEARKTETQRRQESEVEPEDDPESLFVPDTNARDTQLDASLFEEGGSDDEDLRKAIQMSLENPDEVDGRIERDHDSTTFCANSKKVDNNVARNLNSKATGFTMFETDDDEFDLQSALAESRSSKHQPQFAKRQVAANVKVPPPSKPAKTHPFSGPLPFESLDLGSSILGKKKKRQLEEDQSGGFEREPEQEKKEAPPLPPWFAQESQREAIFPEPAKDIQQDDLGTEDDERFERRILNRMDAGEIINVGSQGQEVIALDSDEEGKDNEAMAGDSDNIQMDNVADITRAKPLATTETKQAETKAMIDKAANDRRSDVEESYDWEESDHEDQPLPAVQESPSKSPSPEFEDVEISSLASLKQPAAHVSPSRSPSPEFEDVQMSSLPAERHSLSLDRNRPGEPLSHLSDQSHTEDLPPAPPDDFPLSGEDEYSDPEDEELMLAFAHEAEEHARFAASLNATTANNPIDYEKELRQLRNQQKKDRRDADEVTQIMVQECQALLRHFGLPYITAPMEAEAQCAELVRLGLVDGVVTDDSDIFLFGGTRVYKNMFNQARFVECYLASDLEKEFALDRRKLIRFAHLLGSDYTDGIPGIGPVTALEILTDFSTLDEFSEWWSAVQAAAPSTRKPDPLLTATKFRKKFAKNTTKLFLPPAFPDPRVDQAYLEPDVDSDASAFQWGVPDLDKLRSFLMSTIGWSPERTDEVLVPVIRDMNRRENEGTQANITSFAGFGGAAAGTGAGAFAPRVVRSEGGGRMGRAFERLRKEAEMRRRHGLTGAGGLEELEDEDEQHQDVTDNGDDEEGEDNVIEERGGGGGRRRRLPRRNGNVSHTRKRKGKEAEAEAEVETESGTSHNAAVGASSNNPRGKKKKPAKTKTKTKTRPDGDTTSKKRRTA